jgi:hypothetical protein
MLYFYFAKQFFKHKTMKPYLKILLMMLLLFITTFSLKAQNNFLKIIDEGKAEIGLGAVETPTGDYVIVGTAGDSTNATGNWDGYIVKINSYGDTLWTRTYGGYGTDTYSSVICKGNNYIVVGSEFVFGLSWQGWLVEYDENGNRIAEKLFGGNAYKADGFADIIATTDGGYMVSGTTNSFGTDSTSDIWILKLDSAFDTIWTKHYDLGVIEGTQSYNDNGGHIIPFKNNEYMFTSGTCTSGCNGSDPHSFATYFVIDSVGNIIKLVSFKEGIKTVFACVRPTNDGGAILCGAISLKDTAIFAGMRSENMWVVKLDSNADTIWTKEIGKTGVYDGGFSIFQTSDGGYFLDSYSEQGDCPGFDVDNVWLLKLNSTGDTTWVRKWGKERNDDTWWAIPTSDGGCLAVGSTNANSIPVVAAIPGNSNLLIIKTDANGNFSSTGKEFSENESLGIYPNPAANYLTIDTRDLQSKNYNIRIYDDVGDLVLEKCLSDSKTTLNISSLPVGMYVAEIKTEKGVMVKKFVKD